MASDDEAAVADLFFHPYMQREGTHDDHAGGQSGGGKRGKREKKNEAAAAAAARELAGGVKEGVPRGPAGVVGVRGEEFVEGVDDFGEEQVSLAAAVRRCGRRVERWGCERRNGGGMDRGTGEGLGQGEMENGEDMEDVDAEGVGEGMVEVKREEDVVMGGV